MSKLVKKEKISKDLNADGGVLVNDDVILLIALIPTLIVALITVFILFPLF